MKLLTSKNIQFIALTVLGILVFLAVSRYLYKEGFQSGGGNEMSGAITCKGYQLAIDAKKRDLESAKTDTDRQYSEQLIAILEKKKVDENCAQYVNKMAEIPTPPPPSTQTSA
jgi:hypothetical protein